MTMSRMLETHIQDHAVRYSLLAHPHTGSSMDTATVARVPGGRLAKGIMVKVEATGEYLMVVIPSDHHVDLGRLGERLGHGLSLATEEELAALFPDCERGAVPPIGAAFGHRTLLDRSLAGCPEIYFESGDHETLVRIEGDQLAVLLDGADEVDVAMRI
ncbi:aminoacyl-tRNA deacylase [Thiorhodococcus minor]|uniref:YbaK/EbsC family protein n=1 Tax=Thiorhodococcus minor TaxID=57489 RepID=A0A6M0K4U5_9GAMM|nr:YbaK/EbsC family protein [Thiorhodococcus minor]NEV64449.1 YbaK/EbsC family protein [Thiorhodococcus minor]